MAMWNLGDGLMRLKSLYVSANGGPQSMSGELEYKGPGFEQGIAFPVAGGWTPANNAVGNNRSVFSLLGNKQHDWIAVSGTMGGRTDSPLEVTADIIIRSATGSDGGPYLYTGVLVPDEVVVTVEITGTVTNGNSDNIVVSANPTIGHISPNHKAIRWHNKIAFVGVDPESVYIQPGKDKSGGSETNWNWSRFFSNGPAGSGALEVPSGGYSMTLAWNRAPQESGDKHHDLNYTVVTQSNEKHHITPHDPEMYVDEC